MPRKVDENAEQSSSSSRDEEGQRISVEDRRRRRVAFDEMAKRMLGYLEDSEDLKVGISELERRAGNAGGRRSIHHAHCQAGKERGRPKDFRHFQARNEEVCIASLARWNTHVKSLAQLERRCQGMMQEVKLLSERQEVLKGMVGRQDQVAEQGVRKVL